MSFSPYDTCNASILDVRPYIPGKSIASLQEKMGFCDTTIKLSSNENPLGASPRAIAALKDAASRIHFYPDGGADGELRENLAQRHNICADNITLGCGSNEILDLVARCFLSPKTKAIFSQYAFAIYPIVCQLVGAATSIAKAKPMDTNMPLGDDLETILDCIDKATRVVFIANPNNPTGTWVRGRQLRDFLQCVPPYTVIVVDQAYVEYAMDAKGYRDAMEWVDEYPNLIVTQTFSKVFGLAGLRIGYAVSSVDIASLLNRIRQPFNVTQLAMVAANASLEDKEHIVQSVAINCEEMKSMRKILESWHLRVLPSAANFLTVEFPSPKSWRRTHEKGSSFSGQTFADNIYHTMLQRGVIARPLANYQMPDFLRFTLGTKEQNEKVVKVLKALLMQNFWLI